MCLQDYRIGLRAPWRALIDQNKNSGFPYTPNIPPNSRRIGLIINTSPTALSTATWYVNLSVANSNGVFNQILMTMNQTHTFDYLEITRHGLIVQAEMQLSNVTSTEGIHATVIEVYSEQDLANLIGPNVPIDR